MYTRFSKIMLVWAVAFFALLAAFSNLADYDSNYRLVSHVLKMDTTFPDNQGMWRAIEAPWIHHLAYIFIILTEITIALLCGLGGYRLFNASKSADDFNQAKGMAIVGLTTGIILWFTGFITIGGEWFMMWQSQVANGQQAAFRLVAIIGIILVFIAQPDDENNA